MLTNLLTYDIAVRQDILHQNYIQTLSPVEQKFYHCDVIFGAPSAGCRGTGICRIIAREDNIPGVPAQKNCKQTRAMFVRTQGEGSVELILFRNTLCAQIVRHHLDAGILYIPEACPLPAGMIAHLNIRGKRIQPGLYKVEERQGFFRIQIRIDS